MIKGSTLLNVETVEIDKEKDAYLIRFDLECLSCKDKYSVMPSVAQTNECMTEFNNGRLPKKLLCPKCNKIQHD